MKKLVLTTLFLLGIVQLANATPVDCSVLMAANTSGSSSSVCTVTPDPGFFISALTLTATDDYTGYQSGSPIVSFSANLTQTSLVFTGINYCNVDTIAQNSNPCLSTVLPASTVSGLNLSTYSVDLTNASNNVLGGVVTGDSIVLALDYAETQIPRGSVPEPVTVGFMGVALLGVSLLARKKKANQAQS